MKSLLIHGVGFLLTTFAIALAVLLGIDYETIGYGLNPWICFVLIVPLGAALAWFVQAFKEAHEDYVFMRRVQRQRRRTRIKLPDVYKWPMHGAP